MVATYRTMARAYRGKRRTVRRKAPGKVRARRGSRTKSYGSRKSGRITRLKTRSRQRFRKTDRQRVTPLYGQNITYVRNSIGRKKLMNWKKYDSKACLAYVKRMQGVQRQNTATSVRDANGIVVETTTPGWYYLQNRTIEAGRTENPIHLWSLNDKLDSGVNIGKFLEFGLGGTVLWQDLAASQTSNGTFAGNTQYKDEYQNTAATLPESSVRFQRHMWYDIRMNLYGTTLNAVTYDVYLVRFMQDTINPRYLEYDSTEPTAKQFWHGMVQPVVYNTILPKPFSTSHGMMVMKHKRVVIEAASNDDLDAAPQCVQLKWFYRDGSISDYMHNAAQNTSTAIRDGGWSERGLVSTSEFTNYPRSKGQIHLIIRASNPVPDLTMNGHGSPSYDLLIRRRTQLMV